MIDIQWHPEHAHEWQRLYDSAPVPTAYQQHWAYGEAVTQMGGEVARAIIYDNETPIALYQCAKRSFWKASLWLGMRGPVWLKENLSDDIKCEIYQLLRHDYPKQWPSIHMIMPEEHSDQAIRTANLKRVMTGYSTVTIDLSQSEDTLLSAMEGKWRNRLRTAQKSELSIHAVSNKPSAYRWILMSEHMQRARIGYVALTPELVPLYQLHAGRDSVIALRASLNRDDVAAMLCLIHGNTATYHIGFSNQTGKETNAHNVLMWEMMLKLKKCGIRWFDLGGVNTEKDGAGIARFKLGTGGKLTQLAGTYT